MVHVEPQVEDDDGDVELVASSPHSTQQTQLSEMDGAEPDKLLKMWKTKNC